jgi:hypothetical protein
MDQAWDLEKTFWTEAASGGATAFYARHMAADGFVVLPNRIVSRNDLVARWTEMESVRSFELSDPTFTLLEGGNVVITYHATVDAPWLSPYRAHMTVLYSWQAGHWTLVFRAHTPESSFPF